MYDSKKFKQALRGHHKRIWQKRKEDRKKAFESIYDKKRKIEFKSGEDLNMKKHFRFPKINEGFNLPLFAQAVYPVMCSRADFRDEDKSFQISRENIAKLTGISPNSVDSGIEFLSSIRYEGRSLLCRDLVQDGKRRYYSYFVQFPKYEIDDDASYFVFYTCIIDSGIWARLSLRAKAFYISARTFSYFDYEVFEEISSMEKSEYINNPDEVDHGQWQITDKTKAHLCRMANISAVNINKVIKELERVGLMEDNNGFLIVRTKPTEQEINKCSA